MTENVISYLSDRNGIINNYFYELNTLKNHQLTNYKRCIIRNDLASNAPVIADLLYFNNRYRIYVGTVAEDYQSESIKNAENTLYRKWLNNDIDSSLLLLDFIKSDTSKSKVLTPSESLEFKKIYISGFDEYEDLENSLKNEKRKNDPYIGIAKTHFGIEYFLQQFVHLIKQK